MRKHYKVKVYQKTETYLHSYEQIHIINLSAQCEVYLFNKPNEAKMEEMKCELQV